MGYNPSYKWTNPTYPIYNQGYNPLTKWDEPPSNIRSPTIVYFSDNNWKFGAYPNEKNLLCEVIFHLRELAKVKHGQTMGNKNMGKPWETLGKSWFIITYKNDDFMGFILTMDGIWWWKSLKSGGSYGDFCGLYGDSVEIHGDSPSKMAISAPHGPAMEVWSKNGGVDIASHVWVPYQ